ncbi:response regulator receiver modulated serine phosphatase [Candidatus Moduliflexus flocculans]|uniref:Response regulator receiver modulated serine phosphatase n=1 Tax=Candidatus Moduliflexus flocculans TaxID=1499966 RepID=A0A081BLI1_9BACT|nr:response regulator receiver modulated serine phosphatase [Candidatus Moduliflexus flocculans]
MKGEFQILVVDDSRMNRMVLSKSLSMEGYELIEAESADAALKILDYRKPELILLDVVMPEMTGFDLCRLLKQQKATREIPIIFITSLDSTEDKIKGLELGAVDFITKPFNTAEILARVRTQVTLRQMYRTILETNQRIQKDLATARRIQQNLLPEREIKLAGQLTFEYVYLPCDELGGDFFDIYQLSPHHILFYILDVSGHGVASSLITIFTKIFFSIHGKAGHTPGQLLNMLNQQFFRERLTEKYVTVFLGILDINVGRLTWSSAGQSVSPILFSSSQEQLLSMHSFPIGLLENVAYSDESCDFQNDASLLLYSDGVMDIHGANGQPVFDEQTLLTYIREQKGSPKMVDSLFAHIRQHAHVDDFPDDVTIFLLRRNML